MLLETEALAANNASKIIFVYIPGGITASQWFPSGSATDFTLPFISSPLDELKSDLIMFEGLNSIGPGNHSGGPKQVFAGGGGDGTVLNSLDQALAAKFLGMKLLDRVAIGLGSTQSADGHLCSWLNGSGIKTLDDPVANYESIFGNFSAGSNATAPTEQTQASRNIAQGKKRIIDYAMKDIKSLEGKLGQEEKDIFNSHLAAIDQIGKDLQSAINQQSGSGQGSGEATASCAPKSIDFSKLKKSQAYWPLWYHQAENTAEIAKINRQMMIQAFACDLTNVGLLQFGASNTQMALNFDGYDFDGTMHHSLTHSGGQSFYNVQQAMIRETVEIAKALKSISLGGKSLLSQMSIFGSSCIGGSPNNHDGRNIPCFILGQANGAFKTGRYLKQTDVAYNHLLVSIAKAYGLNVDTYGNKNFAGGLPSL